MCSFNTMVHRHRNRIETQNLFISQYCIPEFGIVQSTIAQVNNSMPTIRRNSCDFVDVLHEIAWLSRTCVCFLSLLSNGTFFDYCWTVYLEYTRGGGLQAVSTERGPLHAWVGKATPKSWRLADTERTPSEPLVDPKLMQNFEKRTNSRPRVNLKGTRGPLLGSTLV